MPETVIEVVELRKQYGGGKPVLDGISFTVKKQEFVTIYGKSGCGKTTLLNILGGLDRPTSGMIEIDGRDISGMSEDQLARVRLQKIGFVFQDYNLLMDLTVRENVALPMRLSRSKDQGRVDDLLKRFDISHVADEKANRISGGEAQRAAIARALMNDPKIILADEPTGNLDQENTENVIKVFQLAIKDFGMTVVLATHDQELASFATSTIFLAGGKSTIGPI